MAKIPKILKNAAGSLRPTVKMVGNSIDFDSIYNHSIPKKITKSAPKFEIDKAQDLLNNVQDFFNKNVDNIPKPNVNKYQIPKGASTDELFNMMDTYFADKGINPTALDMNFQKHFNNGLDAMGTSGWDAWDSFIKNDEIDIDSMYEAYHQKYKDMNPNRTGRALTPEELEAVNKANAQWQADSQAYYEKMDRQIENMYEYDNAVYGSPEDILDPNYVSEFDPIETSGTGNTVLNTTDTAPPTNINPTVDPINTVNTNSVENNIDNALASPNNKGRSRRDGKNVRQQNKQRQKKKNKGRSGNKPGKSGPSKSIDQLNKEAKQRKWSTETYNQRLQQETLEKIENTRQMYEDVLTDWKSSYSNYSNHVENYKLTGTHKMHTESKNYVDAVEDLKVNYNIEDYVDGSYTMDKEVFKYSKGTGLNGEDVLKVEGDLIDAPNAYASDLNKILKEAEESMDPEEFIKFKNGFDPEKALVKTDAGSIKLNREKVIRNQPDLLSKFGTVDMVMSGVNLLGAVGDYKDYRRKGHGVISSAVRTGVQFAAFEALGLYALPVMAAKELPGLAVKGATALYKENRRMNSAANQQTFGGAQFMDTQQLATMRQSGMEMAKMAQYNLQQTLMGNEATYLHR